MENEIKSQQPFLPLIKIKNQSHVSSIVDKIKEKVHIEKASILVENANHRMMKSICKGNTRIMDTNLSISVSPDLQKEKKSKRNKSVTISLDEHRNMMKKFKKQNKQSRHRMQMRSMQMSQIQTDIRQRQGKIREEERNKELETRRKLIEKKMIDKKKLLLQLKNQYAQGEKRLYSVHHKNLLERRNLQKFEKEYVIPRKEEEKKALQKKKEQRSPMDFKDILIHQKQYETIKKKNHMNRIFTSRMMNQQTFYQPPKFIPQAYVLSVEEEQKTKLKEEEKKQEKLIAIIRKKEAIRSIEEENKLEAETYNSIERVTSTRNKILLIKELSPQQKKSLGNEYLKGMLSSVKKKKNKTKMLPKQIQKKPKSPQEIVKIKQQRIKVLQWTRQNRIKQIMKNENQSNYEKYENLKYQVNRLDKMVEKGMVESQDPLKRDQATALYLNSIEAKLSILNLK